MQVTRLKRAATDGDVETVISTLAEIPKDEMEKLDKACIVREVAGVCTTDKRFDGKLRDVLRVLADAGWKMDGQEQLDQDNALHVLAGQRGGQATRHRTDFLIDWSMQQQARRGNILTARNANRMTPDQCAVSAGIWPLATKLRQKREAVERDSKQAGKASKAEVVGDPSGRREGPTGFAASEGLDIAEAVANGVVIAGVAVVGFAAFGLLQSLLSDGDEATQDAGNGAIGPFHDAAHHPQAKATPHRSAQSAKPVRRVNWNDHGCVTIEDVE